MAAEDWLPDIIDWNEYADLEYEEEYDRALAFKEQYAKVAVRTHWRTKQGEIIAVEDMKTSHIFNAYKMLERNGGSREWMDIFNKEHKKRTGEYIDPIYGAAMEESEKWIPPKKAKTKAKTKPKAKKLPPEIANKPLVDIGPKPRFFNVRPKKEEQ